MVQEQGIYIQYRRRPILELQKPLIQHNRLYTCFHATVVCHVLHPEQVEKRYSILTVVFYSTDFKDSTIGIFFSLRYITRFTMMANTIVIATAYRKESFSIFLPNITVSSSASDMIKECSPMPSTSPASAPISVRKMFSLYT